MSSKRAYPAGRARRRAARCTRAPPLFLPLAQEKDPCVGPLTPPPPRLPPPPCLSSPHPAAAAAKEAREPREPRAPRAPRAPRVIDHELPASEPAAAAAGGGAGGGGGGGARRKAHLPVPDKEDDEPGTLRIRGTSKPKAVAGAVANKLRSGETFKVNGACA